MPAYFGYAAVGLSLPPGDEQNFLGARHRDIEQPPMLLGRRQRRRLISRRERPVALVGGQREDGPLVPPRDVDGKGPVTARGIVGGVSEDDDRRLQALRTVPRHPPPDVPAIVRAWREEQGC